MSFVREKIFEIITLLIVSGTALYNVTVFKTGMEFKNAEHTKRIEHIEILLERITDNFSRHLIWAEGRSQNLEALRRDVEMIENRIEKMNALLYRQRDYSENNGETR